MATVSGNVTTVGIGTNGTPLAAAPQTGLPTGNGWTQAGNFGVAKGTTAEGLKVGARATIGLPQGRSLPLTIASSITPANLFKGFRAFAGPGLIFEGVPMVLQWMADSGVRVNPAGTGMERSDPSVCTVAPCYRHQMAAGQPWYSSVAQTCTAGVAYVNALFGGAPFTSTGSTGTGPSSICHYTRTSNGAAYNHQVVSQSIAAAPAGWLPASMDDIAPYMQAKQPEPGVINEMLSRGVKLDVNTPTVTGPASVAGPTSTSTDQTGKVTTTTITYKPTYNDNRVTNNIETTVTTYNPATGETVTEQTKVEEAPEPEKDQEDQCEKHPDRAGCADLDTPEGDIPREDVEISYEEQNLFGDGQCPADRTATLGTLGMTVKVFDWQQACSMMLPLRALVIALATFAAAVIIMPVRVDV